LFERNNLKIGKIYWNPSIESTVGICQLSSLLKITNIEVYTLCGEDISQILMDISTSRLKLDVEAGVGFAFRWNE
jgi:hypothetical protein